MNNKKMIIIPLLSSFENTLEIQDSELFKWLSFWIVTRGSDANNC